MDLSLLLAIVEHEVRGTAATVGALAKLLAEGRVTQAEQPTAFERLKRASLRLEQLANDASALASWSSAETTAARRWHEETLGSLLDAALADGDAILRTTDDDGRWRARRVRVSDTRAFAGAVRAIIDLARREQGDSITCRVRLHDDTLDLLLLAPGTAPGGPIVDRVSLGRCSGGLKPVLAAAILGAHGGSVWRPATLEGIGLSMSLTPEVSDAPPQRISPPERRRPTQRGTTPA